MPAAPGGKKPPVTQQEDWATVLQPWLQDMVDALGLDGAELDVDRIHQSTGVIAHEVQRSMAPIASFLLGIAVGRGVPLEQACRVVEDATMRREGVRRSA